MKAPRVKTMSAYILAALTPIIAYTAGLGSARWLIMHASEEARCLRSEQLRARVDRQVAELGAKVAILTAQVSTLTSNEDARRDGIHRLRDRLDRLGFGRGEAQTCRSDFAPGWRLYLPPMGYSLPTNMTALQRPHKRSLSRPRSGGSALQTRRSEGASPWPLILPRSASSGRPR